MISRKCFKSYPLLLGAISGFSVFYFLYFFEAFRIQSGPSYSGHSLVFRSISFGLLTFLYLFLFEGYLKPLMGKMKLVGNVFWYLTLVGLGSLLIFLLFNYYWNGQEFNWEAYFLITKELPLMLVIPFTFYFTIRYYSTHRNNSLDFIVLQSENGKDVLKIKETDFLFAASEENYISIAYRSQNKVKNHLIRKTLKALENELKNQKFILRVHRSFLINEQRIENIIHTKGKLYLEIGNQQIRVSKKYQNHFLA